VTLSNNPPARETWALHIEELFHEAQSWLDGAAIETQGQADNVGKLLDALRVAKRDADAARAVEKKPFDDGAREVQAAWKPLIDKCDLAANVAKKALTPWLEKLAEEQRAEAKRLAEEAETARLKAMEAHRAASTDLTAASAARDLDKAATGALKAAARAEKAKPQATGGARAIGLRTSWTAEVTDPVAFGAWLWANRRPDYLEWLEGMANELARIRPTVPGIIYHEGRSAA
jgi:hypothetical protein